MSAAKDRAQVAAMRTFQRLPKSVRQPLVRTLTPTFTVSVMAHVTRDDGRALYLRHSYMPGWGLPGGIIDRGEALIDAIVRETREEVGLEVVVTAWPTYTFDAKDRVVRFIASAVVAEGVDPDSARPTSSEIVEARWFPPSEAPPLIDPARDALVALNNDRGESR